jgi:hypothetical protein
MSTIAKSNSQRGYRPVGYIVGAKIMQAMVTGWQKTLY